MVIIKTTYDASLKLLTKWQQWDRLILNVQSWFDFSN